MSNFKKIGHDIYLCDTPSFQTPGGTCYAIETQHAYHPTLEEADDKELVKQYRLEILIRQRMVMEHHNKGKKYVIVMYEKCWKGEIDKSNFLFSQDQNLSRVYNSVRGKLVEKSLWEGETTWKLT